MDKYVLSSVIIDSYSLAVERRVNAKLARWTMDTWLAHTILCTGSFLWVADYCDSAIQSLYNVPTIRRRKQLTISVILNGVESKIQFSWSLNMDQGWLRKRLPHFGGFSTQSS
jgi:glycerol kinase